MEDKDSSDSPKNKKAIEISLESDDEDDLNEVVDNIMEVNDNSGDEEAATKDKNLHSDIDSSEGEQDEEELETFSTKVLETDETSLGIDGEVTEKDVDCLAEEPSSKETEQDQCKKTSESVNDKEGNADSDTKTEGKPSPPEVDTECHEVLDSDDDDCIKIVDEISKNDKSRTTDGDDGVTKSTGTVEVEDEQDDEDEKNMPTIRLNTGIFDAEEEEEDDDDQNVPMDIGNMMTMELNEENDDSNSNGYARRPSNEVSVDNSSRRSTPRRAAAKVAADSIKVMSSSPETGTENDLEYLGSGKEKSVRTDVEKYRCHQCKKMEPSLILVQQYGTDIHLCSNNCFNAFRNPDPAKRPLACSKCGTLDHDIDNAKTYYWETMNFCSDVCVAKFQMEIGANCSSCSKKVMWGSLGKYCVRFGSDIRQFCTAGCLEVYKKNARVCFHCQLDIKRLGNVILANIPAKASPKEFCSQECVEMYVEQNLNQQIVSKPDVMITCCMCKQVRKLLKELVRSSMSYKACSEACWKRLQDAHQMRHTSKCETCTKFINVESLTPSFFLASDDKTIGFCSATCKNVYVLKHRTILSCTNCKVKKYNYDLIQFINAHKPEYVVCSLNCLPRPSQYILNLKASLTPLTPLTASELYSRSSNNSNQTSQTVDPGFRIQSISSLANSSTSTLTNGNGPIFSYADGTSTSEVTLRQASDDDIIEIRDDDIAITNNTEEEVSLEDERWAECETLIIVREPEPVLMRNKACMVRPIRITKAVQTDSEELWAMPRVEMKAAEPDEKICYVPVPIPYAVYLPFPFYALETPIPMPFPVPVPIPIPIPVDSSLIPKELLNVNSSKSPDTDSEATMS